MDAIFTALADPNRRLILDELAQRHEQTLYELCARLVMKHDLHISRQAVTKHLAVLEAAGLVASARRGKYRVVVFDGRPLEHLTDRWVGPGGGSNPSAHK